MADGPYADGPYASAPPVTPDRDLTLDDGYRVLFDASPAPMWVHDSRTLEFLEVNAAAVAHYGYRRDDFLAMRVPDLRAADGNGLLGAVEDTTHPAQPTASRGPWRHRRRDGTLIHVEVTGAPVVFAGRPARLVLARDVTHELRLSRRLRESEDILREAQHLAHLGRWEWDAATGELDWSAELYEIFGVAPDTFVPSYEAYLERVHPDDRARAAEQVEEALHSGGPFALDHRIVLPDGSVRWLHSWGRPAGEGRDPAPGGGRRRDPAPGDRGGRLLGICQDITVQKDTEQALTRLALHDPLTGLCNRALLMDRLTSALARLDQAGGRTDRSDAGAGGTDRSGGLVAVLFIDLDRFKTVNDSLGHAAGDDFLVAVAGRLRQVVRPADTIARLGGDEFAVVCEGLADDAAARDVAARIRAALNEPVHVDGRTIPTSASVGVALSRDPAASAGQLLRDADMAMYQAKDAGRNRYAVFDPATRARDLARARRSAELRVAIDRGELEVYYQPEVDLADEAFTGLEALVRWRHPSLGLLTPAAFIDIAEETGFVVALGEHVLREACREVVARRRTPGQERLGLAVNLSARQLVTGEFAGTLRGVLGETGLAPERLCLEITESVLMEDIEASIEALSALKALGVRLAIDDFGTGYSSLSYLRRFPVDVVKLDRSFVAGLGLDPAATAIVSAVVNLSHALGLSVVAEGVESEEQLVALRALRCDRAQGYYWSPPLPGDGLTAWQRDARVEPLAASPIDVYRILVDATATFVEATGRTVVLQAPPNLASAFGEPNALRSAVGHLLANAAKYSEPDRPIVVSAAGDRRWVRVSVADFGVGMTPAESVRCFEQFWQADSREGYRRQGTGIGLYIVRSLVEEMGGEVAVRSAPGKGSTFTVALPRSVRVAERIRHGAAGGAGLGEESSIREFMRQIGVPGWRGR